MHVDINIYIYRDVCISCIHLSGLQEDYQQPQLWLGSTLWEPAEGIRTKKGLLDCGSRAPQGGHYSAVALQLLVNTRELLRRVSEQG